MKGRILAIAGSDSGAGAGIQADIKTIMALGGFATTAITALTAQNTLGVLSTHVVPADFVRQQIDAVLSDIGADAIKIGMLADEGIVKAVAEALVAKAPNTTIILDPVMISTSGQRLLAEAGCARMVRDLFPIVGLLTPNIPEAEALTGLTIRTLADMHRAATKLLAQGIGGVLLKGGHGESDIVTDLLLTPHIEREFTSPRLIADHTHGTGCTLASGIAVSLAQGLGLIEAIERARRYVRSAIQTAPGYGQGNGPINHATNDVDGNGALL